MKRQTGTTLLQFNDNRVYEVDVMNRSATEKKQIISEGNASWGVFSSDGTEIAFTYCPKPGLSHPTPYFTGCPAGPLRLGIVKADGNDFREFASLANPSSMCWSHDKSKLALHASDTLEILDLSSKTLREVSKTDDWTTSQCWSPDDKKIAYTENKDGGIQTIFIFDLPVGESRMLARGALATWSPDGTWIAFLDQDGNYRAIRPDGSGNRRLFRPTTGVSALLWSPDSHYLAYVSARGLWERWPSQQLEELTRLRIRRAFNGSEAWVLNFSRSDDYSFQWVRP